MAGSTWWVLFSLCLLAASASDLGWRRVPNTLNGTICAAGLIATASQGGGWAGLTGMGAGFVLLLGPFALRLYRGGDVKLMIALGAWLGAWRIVWACLFGVALGASIGIAMLALDRELRQEVIANLRVAGMTRQLPREVNERAQQRHVPMALAFSMGALLAAWQR